MADADFKRIMELAASLPDDHALLPPRGRRLVVQVVRQNSILARVYDKANAPDNVLEMLRLVGADTWPIFPFPQFLPDQEWKPGETEYSKLDAIGFSQNDTRNLATSPDGNLVVLSIDPCKWFNPTVRVENLAKPRETPYRTDMDAVLRIKNVGTGAIAHETREPMVGNRCIFIYAARFTPDRHYLLAMSNLPELQIYDTSTWERVDRIPGVPLGAVAFYPSPNWKRAVVAFDSGEVSILEIPSVRGLARIDFGDDLQNVVWSPDGSRVAVVTSFEIPNQAFRTHLRIWNAATGNLLHELWPREGTSHNYFDDLFWWPDGKYLLAAGSMTGI
jgi:WD40 repeat protein